MPGPVVVHVMTSMDHGGVQSRLIDMLPRMRDAGWLPRVVCIERAGTLASELSATGIPVDVVPTLGRLNPFGLWRLACYLRRHDAAVMHGHMYHTNVTGTVAAFMARTPAVIAHNHNIANYRGWRRRLLDRALMPWRDAYAGVSRQVCENTAADLGVPLDRFTVLHNGVDIAPIPAPPDRRPWLAQHDLPEDALVVVCIGRLHPQKNHAGLIAAWPTVLQSVPDAVLLIAGEGQCRDTLAAQIRTLGLVKQVRLLGYRCDIATLNALADVAVLPSLKEGFGNVVLEAMTQGTPVLVTDAGGTRDIVRHGEHGWLHDPHDMATFARLLSELLTDSALRLRFSLAGRERVKDFSIEAMTTATLGLYRKVLSAKGVPCDGV